MSNAKLRQSPIKAFMSIFISERTILRLEYSLPFSPFSGMILRNLAKNAISVLDVGCGKGAFGWLRKFRAPKFFLVGIDIYLPYLRYCKKHKLYDGLILADANHLPFREGAFSIVLALELIEHLTKTCGRSFLEQAEKVASKQVIISTPAGFSTVNNKNLETKFQLHLSGWTPDEFRNLGYKVRGGWGPAILPKELAYLVSRIIPLTYFAPEASHNMVCIKTFKTLA